jgi:hypothetical protein
MIVTEKIGVTAFHGAIAKRIHADGKTRKNLVERTSPLISLLPARRNLSCCCSCPSGIFSVTSHNLREG